MTPGIPSSSLVTADDASSCLTFAGTGVLARLRELGRAVTVAELARILGVHRNTVARHLEALVGAGLVLAERAPRTGQRGRPAYLYRASEEEFSGRREFAQLATLLAGELSESSDAEETATRLGRRWGEQIIRQEHEAGRPAPCPVDYLTAVGFAPTLAEDRHTLRLCACPLLPSAAEHPGVVCTMHATMVATLFEAHGVEVTSHEARQFVEPGVCHLTVGPGEIPHPPKHGQGYPRDC